MKKILIFIIVALIAVIGSLYYFETINEKGNRQTDSAADCQINGGKWLSEFKECENANHEWCQKNNGRFFDCESACRHQPNAEVCIDVCVPVCKFNGNTKSDDDLAAENKAKQDFKINKNLIVVDSPKIFEEISSPLKVTGKARGTWYFESSFPLAITDWEGNIIAQKYAMAQDDWMTENFVPFEGTIEFQKPQNADKGYVVFEKDNPSGLPENNDSLKIPVYFK